MPGENVMPKADFMYKLFVDEVVKKLVDEQTVWEGLLSKQKVDALHVRYYKEQYLDIETPNDSDMSRPIDPYLRSPAFRAPGAAYPHTTFGEPKEYSLGLYQLALEVDIPEEAQQFVELENRIVKAQQKLANSFASKVNMVLGNAITENWTGSSINVVSISSGAEWSVGATSSAVRPIKDILDAVEKVEDVPGYAYKVSGIWVSKQSYFDLRLWLAEKNINYADKPLDIAPETRILAIEGYPVHSSNQVKRDTAVVADFKACGVLFEARPFRTSQYWSDETHVTHIQADRTFNFALTDPKAVCLIKNTA